MVVQIIDVNRVDGTILVRAPDGTYYIGTRARRMANLLLKDGDWVHLDINPYAPASGRITHPANPPEEEMIGASER